MHFDRQSHSHCTRCRLGRRSEASKIRRKIVTLRAAGPRVRAVERGHDSHTQAPGEVWGVCVWGSWSRSHAGRRQPSAGVLQPVRRLEALLNPRGAPGRRSFQGMLRLSRLVPFGSSVLRFFDVTVGRSARHGPSPEVSRDSSFGQSEGRYRVGARSSGWAKRSRL